MSMDKKTQQRKREVYIIKIFRRSNTPGETLVGTVEEIYQKKKRSFKTEEELLRLLSEPSRFLIS